MGRPGGVRRATPRPASLLVQLALVYDKFYSIGYTRDLASLRFAKPAARLVGRQGSGCRRAMRN